MTIVGQPKTTAQYIQVSGRVGRRWFDNRPGLVVTLYSAAKPRDRSHFEHFRGYHQRLYAQVEPASVTPWSGPAVQRALHATIIGYVRQYGLKGAAPFPTPTRLITDFKSRYISSRRSFMTAEEVSRVEARFDEIRAFWENRQPGNWGDFFNTTEDDLIFSLGQTIPGKYRKKMLPTPTSMRSVDGQSSLKIDNPYAILDGDQ